MTIDERTVRTPVERLDLPPTLEAPYETRRRRRAWWRRRRGGRVILPDGTAPERPASRVTRFFLLCGAVDEALLETRAEYFRFVNQGVFVCLVGVLAGVSMTLYLTTIFGYFSAVFLPAAVLWGVLVFFLDRSIVAEPTYGDLTRAHQRWRRSAALARETDGPAPRRSFGRRLGDGLRHGSARSTKVLAYGFRVVVAVLVAWLVGEAIMLTIFSPEITTQLNKRHTAAFSAAVDDYLKPTRDEIAALTAERARNDAMIKQLQTDVDNAKHDLELEVSGQGGTFQKGEGPQTDIEKAKYNNLAAGLPEAQRPFRNRNAEIDRTLEQDTASVAAIESGDLARITAIPQLKKTYDDVFANQGWVEQEAALDDYLRENAASPAVAAVPWLVRGILLAIDLLPLMLKIASSTTVYGQRMRDRADRIRYRDVVDDEVEMDRIDRDATARRHRDEALSDIYRQHDDWQRRERIGTPHGDRNERTWT